MTVSKKKRPAIIVEAAKCQGCLICIMRCGLRFDRSFNPQAARINVIPYFNRSPEISFKERCDRCGICVRYCPTGALSYGEKTMDRREEV